MRLSIRASRERALRRVRGRRADPPVAHRRDTVTTVVLYWRSTGRTRVRNWYCTRTALVLHRCYSGATLAPHWHCTGPALALRWHRSGIVLVLRWHCAVLVMARYWYDTGTGSVLHSYYTCTTPMLHWFCTGVFLHWCTARVLYCSWTGTGMGLTGTLHILHQHNAGTSLDSCWYSSVPTQVMRCECTRTTKMRHWQCSITVVILYSCCYCTYTVRLLYWH